MWGRVTFLHAVKREMGIDRKILNMKPPED
jgi:hypothetical protein